jgi:hypothetical protein
VISFAFKVNPLITVRGYGRLAQSVGRIALTLG